MEAEVERLMAKLKATEGSLASFRSSPKTSRQRILEAVVVCRVACAQALRDCPRWGARAAR